MNIDKELTLAMSLSSWRQIPYDRLLETNPKQIRVEEALLMDKEGTLEIPKEVIVENQVISTEENTSLALRIYKPKQIDKLLPVILFLHGGAFVFGSTEQYDFQLFDLVKEAKVIVVSVGYRLAPEHPFPAALEDSRSALCWIYEQIEKTGGDRHRISIMGSSAGGTIALSLLHLNKDIDYIPILSAFILYPPTSDELHTHSMSHYAEAPMQTKKSATYMWKHYLSGASEKWIEYAIPNKMKSYSNLPPITLVLAEYDPLIDEAKEYVNLILAQEGVITVQEIKGAVHTFDFFDCMLTREFNQDRIDYFKNLHTV